MPAAALIGPLPEHPPSLSRVVISATIGNVLEWFDFLVYGFFAVTIAQVFFPTRNPTVSLLITFGTFGLAYFARPLGAVVIGAYTDRHGRRAGLTLSIGLMLIGTVVMAATPGYAAIGLVAPALIVAARLLQGCSVGIAFSYSISVTIFGGFAPFVATWLIARTGDSLSPSYYLMATALLSIIAVIAVQRRAAYRHR